MAEKTEVKKEAEAETGTTAMTVRRPMGLFEQMEREFDEMRRRMFGVFRRPAGLDAGGASGIAWSPTADAYEADGALVVKAELPGVKKEDIAVDVRGGMLTVSGKRHEEKETKEARYYAAERFSGSFSRAFPLPDGVDAAAITAEYKDGVLHVRVPLPVGGKSEAVKIPVNG